VSGTPPGTDAVPAGYAPAGKAPASVRTADADRAHPAIDRVGVVGLGVMGRPMAANLLAAGFRVTVHNRSPGPVAELVAKGAAAGESPADVARRSDAVITMVPDTPDVEAVLFGTAGVAEGSAPGSAVVDMSTISPAATERFAVRLAERGVEMLDAPVSGGEKGAIAGTLAIMVGGKAEVFARCRPVLDALGTHVVHMGPCGNGQRTKLVNQVIGGLHLVALAEGLAFAREAGLDVERVLEIVSRGAAGSWMLSNLGPRALAGDFAPGFTIRLQRKDLELAERAMRGMAVHFPGTALTLDLFRRAERSGLGDQGTQGLVNLYRPSST
jgi:3-hydroxyisobutyrate dehydrogenase-like beta-hydroxyacid dehydrogenase